MSRQIGRLASLRIPIWMRERFYKAFGRFFGVDFSEFDTPLKNFERLQDFFIRELKPGARPIAESALVSPCDGVFGQCGQVNDGHLLQIKGKSYSLSDLLGEDAPDWHDAHYATIYLSPKDYHRFHAPCDGRVIKAKHIPGYLWPVNPWAVKNINQLFCVNERLICWLDEKAILVAVGATMVGKVKVRFDHHLTTNNKLTEPVVKIYGDKAQLFKKGEELGHFEFGSTIVMLTKEPLKVTVGAAVRLGEAINS